MQVFKQGNLIILQGHIPLWLKLVYTLFVAVLIPSYWIQYGPLNFLWSCDIALLLAVFALWRESARLASTLAVAVLVPELAWNVDFFARLIAGLNMFGLDATSYMFDSSLPLLVRALSMFHLFLPILLLWLVFRLGYHSLAFMTATGLTWIVLPVCYFFTEPERNINWVFGLETVPQQWMPGIVYLAAMMILVPLLFYLPAHLLLRRIFRSQPD